MAGHSLTNTELNCETNQLARYLVNHEHSPVHLVRICVDRNLEMLVGVLGISIAAGAYFVAGSELSYGGSPIHAG
jgi:non-ribosomal peptide synthetase component F